MTLTNPFFQNDLTKWPPSFSQGGVSPLLTHGEKSLKRHGEIFQKFRLRWGLYTAESLAREVLFLLVQAGLIHCRNARAWGPFLSQLNTAESLVREALFGPFLLAQVGLIHHRNALNFNCNLLAVITAKIWLIPTISWNWFPLKFNCHWRSVIMLPPQI